jgi:mono/diheme cytochrome c family protein
MPANRLKIQEFFEFVLSTALDPRFTADNVIGHIQQTKDPLGPIDRLLYRYAVIPQTIATTQSMRGYMGPLIGDPRVSRWGVGRVDTFNPYKALQFHWDLTKLPMEELSASSDYPSLWNQKPRGDAEMELHWDGNNTSLDERNRSASLGAGVTPTTLDRPALQRVAEWAKTLPPPKYPLPINEPLAARGQQIYAQYCTDCHGDHRFREGFIDKATMTKLGHVEPWDSVRTDRQRLDSYTPIFAQNQYTLYPDTKERFTHFHKTNGYSNQPLDGIWLKAPYLHNGSVPTLRELLDAPEQRPVTFYRGYDLIDAQKLGFVSNLAAAGKETFTLYDTRVLGNGNGGHLWGTQLPPDEKDAIVEYMKKF